MSEFLVFGGKCYASPQGRPAWDLFEAGVLLRVRDGKVVQRMDYGGCAIDKSVGISVCFRAGAVEGDFVWTVTSTEILKIDVKTFAIAERGTHELMNETHSVAPIGDKLYVTATGVDSVIELDNKFELVKRYPIADDELLKQHGFDADYRQIPTTKPHYAHPNFVGAWDGEVWVTNFEKSRVQSLTSDRKYHVAENRIHDGVFDGNNVWFTAVNGEVIQMRPKTGAIESFPLAPMTPTDRLLGWCRGIAPVGGSEVLVGFSKLRATKLRDNLKWIGNKLLKQNFALSEPTRVARYDLARGVETWRLNLEDHGMNAVYSIHVVG